jgi:MFS family permease
MTETTQFNGFIVSRFFSGFFGGVTGVLGPRILVDIFFLHQRGRAFTAFHWCLNFGSVAGPTLSAYISQNRSWTLEMWWTVGLLGFTIICCFLFMHETSWDREPGAANVAALEGFFANRFATFFPGTRVTPKTSARETVSLSRPTDTQVLGNIILTQCKGPNCCNSIPCGLFSCHYLAFRLHSDQFRILHCYERPYPCVPTEARQTWRLRLYDT